MRVMGSREERRLLCLRLDDTKQTYDSERLTAARQTELVATG